MKKTFFLFVFLLLSLFSARGEETPAVKLTPEQKKAIDTFNEGFMNYYKTKKTEKIASFLKFIAQLPPGRSVRAFSSAIPFFGEVYRANPKQLAGWVEIGSGQRQMRFLHINALLYAGTKESALVLKKYMKDHKEELKNLKLPSKAVTDISILPLTVPSMLDACWGGYFASGDPKYVNAVMRTAVRSHDKGLLNMTVTAARWSAASNAKRDPQIMKLVQAFLARCSKEQQCAFCSSFPEKIQKTICGKILVKKTEKNKDK